jgi:hypothetical protein
MAVNPSIQLGTSGNWAIKEDNLLAYKQLGNKFFDREFDFSRGTTATFVGRNGFIQESFLTGAELVTNGDFATDSNWVKNGGATISGGQANIVGDGTSFTSIVQYSIFTIGKKYEVSVDVTISSGLGLKFQDGTNNESIGFATTSGTYVFYFTGTSSADFVIGRRTGGTAFNSSVNNVSIREIKLDVPRIDFTDDPTGHLLLEPQSTNLETESAALTTGWNVSTGATSQIETSITPFGVSGNVYKLTNATNNPPSWTNNLNSLKKQYAVSATNPASFFTFSVYVKSAGSTTINIQLRDNSNGQDVTTGLISLSSEWQRVTISKQFTTSTTSVGIVIAGTDGDILLADAQFEQKSYATSYIPTSGSTVTRNQETCNDSGTVNDFNSEEGVLYAEYKIGGDSTDNYQIISLRDTSTVTPQDLVIAIGKQSFSNDIFIRLTIGSVNVFNNLSATPIDGYNKVAISYKSGNSSAWVNGTKVYSSSSTFTPSLTLSKLSFQWASPNSLNFFGKTKNVKAFKRALTDTELYLLTVTQYQSYQEMATALNYTL